ncbi:MAG: hypothetical protein CSA47_01455 [Gammaproteobacteria bacterium]|nr:MAG: hypothetical protein CSA47_01455 [Gammaproteobacteria bacterium]
MSDANKPNRPSDFNVLTFTVPCPSCGATVAFASVGSIMSVCSYCQTTVVRQGDKVKAQGKQSLTIEDYSPLQIGSSGSFDNHTFVIIGRVQLEYSEGIWNEWYLHFDNGRDGWLSEALGQYTLTLDKGEHGELPRYDDLSIKQSVSFDGHDYTVTDKRMATAIAGEGELPFVMETGWQTWGIDARYKRRFITLDYGEHGKDRAPIVYQGRSVTLSQLAMQMLKDDRQLGESGRLANSGSGDDGNDEGEKRDLDKLDCPNCGSPVPYVAGSTNCLICPACYSEIKLTGDTAEVLKLHSMLAAQQTSLSLGDKARIDEKEIADISAIQHDADTAAGNKHHDYVVIGIQRLEEVGEDADWTEYLLYSFTNGFLWLEEDEEGWHVARVLNELPIDKGRYLQYNDKKWRKQYDDSYTSRVTYAVGAFSWQVKMNDTMLLTDYGNGKQTLTSEQNAEEITYTISSPRKKSTIAKWFGKKLDSGPASTGRPKRDATSLGKVIMANILVIVIILIVCFTALIIIDAVFSGRNGTTRSGGYSNHSNSGVYTTGGRTGYTSSSWHK